MMFCCLEDLNNESDVEQKFLYPLLTSKYPAGLEYFSSDIQTKKDIRKISIGKGRNKRIYFPDYIVVAQGLPLIILEAKGPKEDLKRAFGEARLYAHELNSSYPKDINPCNKIIVSNGQEIWAGSWDSEVVDFKIRFENINSSNSLYFDFVQRYQKSRILDGTDKLFKKIRGETKFIRPISLIGGKSVELQELPENGFGATLAFEYRHIFNPSDIEDRVNVVKNAYISSNQRNKHLKPINRIILAAKPASIIDASEIKDTSNPVEIFDTFKNRVGNEILLLIGNVGCGKSTFVDYLREVALPDDIKEETVWISVDLNNAPLDKNFVYSWIMNSMTEQLREKNANIDFDSLDMQEKLYHAELNKIRKGPAKYFSEDSQQYKDLMSKKLYELQEDTSITTRAYCRFLCNEKGKLLVITLDNCDKRNRDDQLLMFEVAKWLKSEFKCLVFLPLRDTTYDNHKSEAPLDTIVKNLVFRIDPPLLAKVLYRRVEYAISDGGKELSYPINSRMRVTYKPSEQKLYLACILKSLFQNDAFFGNLINGIAGRDIRRGIEIFLDFCKSGYIEEKEIFKIRTSEGDYILPPHIITRILFRNNHRYYTDGVSYIKNLFKSFPKEEVKNDPFVRISILKWLDKRYKREGPNRTLGYYKVSSLISDLLPLGHAEERIIRELGSLVKARCIITESQTSDEEIQTEDEIMGAEIVAGDDLVSIAPCGRIHLNLLNNVDYLSSCSEDIYYSNLQTAQRIADRLVSKSGQGHLSLTSNFDNTLDALGYLREYKEEFLYRPDLFLEEPSESLLDIDDLIDTIKSSKEKVLGNNDLDPEKLKEEFPPGKIVGGKVASVKEYGVFVEMGNNAIGFIYGPTIRKSAAGILYPEMEVGEKVRVRVIKFNDEHHKFNLELLDDGVKKTFQ